MDRKAWLGSLIVLVVFLSAWQWGPGLLGMPEFILPSLQRVVVEFGRMAADDLWMHSGITALDIEVERIEGKAKLSQNRSMEDQARVADWLAAHVAAAPRALGETMQRKMGKHE